jgi:4-hydroxybenzoate polyprenyltransferase
MATGAMSPLHLPYFVVLAGVALHFGWQIVDLKPHDQADCLSKFKANAQVGWLMLAAVVAGQFG